MPNAVDISAGRTIPHGPVTGLFLQSGTYTRQINFFLTFGDCLISPPRLCETRREKQGRETKRKTTCQMHLRGDHATSHENEDSFFRPLQPIAAAHVSGGKGKGTRQAAFSVPPSSFRISWQTGPPNPPASSGPSYAGIVMLTFLAPKHGLFDALAPCYSARGR